MRDWQKKSSVAEQLPYSIGWVPEGIRKDTD
jgi:hypothetical protein